MERVQTLMARNGKVYCVRLKPGSDPFCRRRCSHARDDQTAIDESLLGKSRPWRTLTSLAKHGSTDSLRLPADPAGMIGTAVIALADRAIYCLVEDDSVTSDTPRATCARISLSRLRTGCREIRLPGRNWDTVVVYKHCLGMREAASQHRGGGLCSNTKSIDSTRRARISAPPEVVTSDQEPAVVEKARSMADGCDIEVWQGERLVIHVPHQE